MKYFLMLLVVALVAIVVGSFLITRNLSIEMESSQQEWQDSVATVNARVDSLLRISDSLANVANNYYISAARSEASADSLGRLLKWHKARIHKLKNQQENEVNRINDLDSTELDREWNELVGELLRGQRPDSISQGRFHPPGDTLQ